MVPNTSKLMPGRHFADSRMQPMMARDQHEIDAPRTRTGGGGVGAHGRPARGDRANGRARQKIASSDRRRRWRSAARDAARSRRNRRRAGSRRTAADRRAGVSAPPTLATRMMKNTMTWTLWRRSVIGADQRPDQDHRRARGADDARHPRAERQDGRVVPRRAADVAGDQDAAGDRVEREQQHDEAQIFAEHGMHEGREHRRPPAMPARATPASPQTRPRRSCRSGGARISGTAAARVRSTAAGRRTAAQGPPHGRAIQRRCLRSLRQHDKQRSGERRDRPFHVSIPVRARTRGT